MSIPVVVITRFNLRVSFGCRKREDSNIPAEPWLNEEWLNRRMELFERYTFPSISNQTRKLTWMVLFHDDTPEHLKRNISKLSVVCPNFKPIYLKDYDCDRWRDIVGKIIEEMFPDQRCITIRIDSDDYIHREFVAEVVNTYKENLKNDTSCDKLIVSFKNGLQYDIRNHAIYHYANKANHFLAMMSPSSSPQNHIFNYDHSEIISNNHFICKDNSIPLWVEIVSDINYNNPIRCGLYDLIVPYSIKDEYQELELNWTSRFTYCYECVKNFFRYIDRKIKMVKS